MEKKKKKKKKVCGRDGIKTQSTTLEWESWGDMRRKWEACA